MKKGFLSLVLAMISIVAFAQQRATEWTSILSDRPETFSTQLISSSEKSIQVNVQVPGFYTTSVKTPRGEAKVITLPKALSTAHAGEPDVPMTGIPVMIGDKARMDVRVIDAEYMDFEGIDIAPSKGDFSRQIDPATVPYTYGECYGKDEFFPAKNLDIREPYIIRDFRGQNMAVYPFAYNPVTKTLRVYYNMTVEMYKVDDNGANAFTTRKSSTVKMDQDFKDMYQRHFINYEEASSKYTPLDEAGDLLIICYDNFISSMTDFVNWKKTRGINTTIVGTTTAGSTYSAIKTYITNQYNANNNITHVLLVGDVAQIPGYSYSGGGSSYSGLGDNAYGQIVGSDIYNDVIIGRFSASSAARVTTQCQRAITYERDLNTSASWLQVAQGIAKKEGGSGHNSEDDYQHMDNIRTDLLGYGYNPVYQRYENLSGYTATASQISSDINSGVGIINYCNHGAETMWGVASYSTTQVNALTNENKLPFVFSVACLVGKYDHSSDCFAEAWMNATNNNNPTGAISGMFSYISQPWIPPMWAQDEFIDILVESYSNNIKHTFAGAAINGLFGIFDHYSTSEQSAVGTYQAWIVYGDPTLMMRTKTPQAMTVNHTGSIILGSSSYTVNVNNGNGAVATITDANHNILGKATVSNGSATISISGNLTPGSDLTLCVFGYNKVTYLGTIQVIATGEQYNISANVNPTAAGSVSGTGTYYENSNCTLTATANSGYGFTNWTQNGSQVSTNPSYTFTVTGNATYTANFHQLQQHQITYTAQQSHGTISVSSTIGYAGDIITLTATPDLGYSLDHWTVTAGSETISVENDQFTMPDSDVTVSATFKSEPLTVANGTGTNSEVPFYGLYTDDNYQHTQTIYPASMLTNMQGCQITKLTYYLSSSVTKSFGSTFQVRFGATTSTAFNSGTVNYISINDAAVYSGTLSVSGTTVEFDFSDNPYLYSGGNLVVDVRITALGSGYQSMSFYGESGSTYYSVKSRSTSSLPTTSGTGVSFMPKTTFAFTAPTTDPYISLAPNSATILTGFTQTLTATYGNVSGTPAITYTSSNTSVATVNGNGNTATVTAVAAGTATITASMTYNGTAYTATCAITVEDPSYCEPSFSNPSDDYIKTFVTTGGTTNINNSSTYESSGYSDFYSTQSASIPVGETLSCTVTPSSTSWKYGHAIWVDWNKDYEFTSDERVAYTSSAASGNWTGSVAVPANTNGGDYRMRVIHYYNQASPSDPCVSGQYGEAEDYKLTVIANGTKYTITATANPTAGGTVTGAGQYYEDTQCTLAATPNTNYAFANWTKDGAVVSTNATYSFTVTEDASYVANFNLINTVKIMPNDPELGVVAFGRNRETLTYDFEDGWQGWTTFQGSTTSPHSWMHNTEYTAYDSNGSQIVPECHNSSEGMMLSESYISASTSGGSGATAVTPDNYLVSPQFRLGGSFTFYAASRMSNYPAEKFSVLVSESGNTSASSFTHTELTVTLSDNSWHEYTVDLSEYSGMGYVAIRHYDCTDQHLLYVDDVTIVEGEVADGSVTANYVNGTSCTVVATPNEGYYFANWTENGSVVSTSANYTFTVNADRVLVVNFQEDEPEPEETTQTSELTVGLNWWTATVGTTLADLEAALGENGLMITDSKGKTVTCDPTLGWSTNPNFTELEPGQMYKIKTSTACEIELTGVAINPSEITITLTPGNNWIGFVGSAPVALSEALANLTPTDGDMITGSGKKYAKYDATWGWGGNLSQLVPGEGYIYNSKATSNTDFTYSVSKGDDGKSSGRDGDYYFPEPTPSLYANRNHVTYQVNIDGVLQASEDIEVAAFINDECRGTEFLIEPYPTGLPGQYYTFLTVFGNNDDVNATITFKAYDHATSTEYTICDLTLPFSGEEEAQYGGINQGYYMNFESDPPFGPDYPWVPSSSYSGNGMFVMAQIQVDGVPVTRDSWEVGAFCNDECRGDMTPLDDWTDLDMGYFAEMNIMGNDGDIISFYLYDKAANKVFRGECPTTVIMENDAAIGNDPFTDMFVLNFLSTPFCTLDIEAYTEDGGWYLITSPLSEGVAPTSVDNMLANDYDLYRFNQEAALEWENYKNTEHTNNFDLRPGQGYLYANSEDVRLVFTGELFAEEVCEVDITNVGGSHPLAGWNLIGNPYNVAATLDDDRDFYIMNHEGRNEIILSQEDELAAMEGAFVYAESQEVVTITPKNNGKSMKVNERIVLDLSREGAILDRVMVRMGESKAMPKYMLDESHAHVSIPQDGKEYAVVNGTDAEMFPVIFKADRMGTYTISANVEGVALDYLHLIDNLTGENVDMLLEGSYTFVGNPNEMASRFTLLFNQSGNESVNEIFAYQNGTDVIVNGEGTLEIYDTMGRFVGSYEINGVETIQTLPMGVYIFRMIGDDIKTQKIIVR